MRRIFLAPSFALGIFCLAGLSASASAGIIAIGGTARPKFEGKFNISTLKIPTSTYRRLSARLSYQGAQSVEVCILGRQIQVKLKGSYLVDLDETLLFLPFEATDYQRGLKSQLNPPL